MGNFILNLIRTMIERPIIFLAFILVCLFFPLNVLDYIFIILINLVILIVNVALFIIIIPINIIIILVYDLINLLVQLLLVQPINWLLSLVGQSWNPSLLNAPTVNPPFLSWVYIDVFGTNDTAIGFILDAFGLSFPLF